VHPCICKRGKWRLCANLRITTCFDGQGYDVTLLAAESGPTEEVGLRGIVNLQYTISVYMFRFGASFVPVIRSSWRCT